MEKLKELLLLKLKEMNEDELIKFVFELLEDVSEETRKKLFKSISQSFADFDMNEVDDFFDNLNSGNYYLECELDFDSYHSHNYYGYEDDENYFYYDHFNIKEKVNNYYLKIERLFVLKKYREAFYLANSLLKATFSCYLEDDFYLEDYDIGYLCRIGYFNFNYLDLVNYKLKLIFIIKDKEMFKQFYNLYSSYLYNEEELRKIFKEVINDNNLLKDFLNYLIEIKEDKASKLIYFTLTYLKEDVFLYLNKLTNHPDVYLKYLKDYLKINKEEESNKIITYAVNNLDERLVIRGLISYFHSLNKYVKEAFVSNTVLENYLKYYAYDKSFNKEFIVTFLNNYKNVNYDNYLYHQGNLNIINGITKKEITFLLGDFHETIKILINKESIYKYYLLYYLIIYLLVGSNNNEFNLVLSEFINIDIKVLEDFYNKWFKEISVDIQYSKILKELVNEFVFIEESYILKNQIRKKYYEVARTQFLYSLILKEEGKDYLISLKNKYRTYRKFKEELDYYLNNYY